METGEEEIAHAPAHEPSSLALAPLSPSPLALNSAACFPSPEAGAATVSVRPPATTEVAAAALRLWRIRLLPCAPSPCCCRISSLCSRETKSEQPTTSARPKRSSCNRRQQTAKFVVRPSGPKSHTLERGLTHLCVTCSCDFLSNRCEHTGVPPNLADRVLKLTNEQLSEWQSGTAKLLAAAAEPRSCGAAAAAAASSSGSHDPTLAFDPLVVLQLANELCKQGTMNAAAVPSTLQCGFAYPEHCTTRGRGQPQIQPHQLAHRLNCRGMGAHGFFCVLCVTLIA